METGAIYWKDVLKPLKLQIQGNFDLDVIMRGENNISPYEYVHEDVIQILGFLCIPLGILLVGVGFLYYCLDKQRRAILMNIYRNEYADENHYTYPTVNVISLYAAKNLVAANKTFRSKHPVPPPLPDRNHKVHMAAAPPRNPEYDYAYGHICGHPSNNKTIAN